MTLSEYYTKVKNELKNGNYHTINIKNVLIPTKISLHIETLNYMIYEWNEDHKDSRNDIFDYVIRPNNCDFDFTTVDFKDFFRFLMSSKDDNVEMLNIIENDSEVQIDIVSSNDDIDEFWLR